MQFSVFLSSFQEASCLDLVILLSYCEGIFKNLDVFLNLQVSCCEEEVYVGAEGAAAERAESVCRAEYYQPHHGGQVL